MILLVKIICLLNYLNTYLKFRIQIYGHPLNFNVTLSIKPARLYQPYQVQSHSLLTFYPKLGTGHMMPYRRVRSTGQSHALRHARS